MATPTSLLPTAVSIDGASAIEAVLSDIPLFCEGIMGIGVFTFLFITKQVKTSTAFLYASSFLAFVAATLDLSQVLIRGPQNLSPPTMSLENITGFIFAREVFLTISILCLDLFFWFLIAQCPRSECVERRNGFQTQFPRPISSIHSASWNRWGIIGTILKYGSLAALLAVPLLSLLWRLIPSQRSYSSIYVAESIIQTSIMAIFLLKLLLNVSISPLESWWHALRGNVVPIASLTIGITLGVGNLVNFAFTETPLGRLLRAVEVYLVIVLSLFEAFHLSQQRFAAMDNLPSEKLPVEEKTRYITSELPIAYFSNGYSSPPRNVSSNRVSTLSWVMQPRTLRMAAQDTPPQRRPDSSVEPKEPSRRPQGSEKKLVDSTAPNYEQSSTGVSLSYYAMDVNVLSVNEATQPAKMKDAVPRQFQGEEDSTTDGRTSSSRMAVLGSYQGSVSSIDEILRQQTELDETIAALRLTSMSIQPDPVNIISSNRTTNKSRSGLTGSKTESFSNRSDFSLSIFPNPPTIPTEEVATKYPAMELHAKTKQQTNSENASSDNTEIPTESLVPASSTAPLEAQIESKEAKQYDVTSFIGDLSEPSRGSQTSVTLSEDLNADSEGTPIFSTVRLAPTNGLRPMILSSAVMTTPSNIRPVDQTEYAEQRISNADSTISLRPLLLGNPSVKVAPIRISPTMIPLAKRRQRGGTISSDTRRPVISFPRPTLDRNEGIPEAFERPRPLPLRL